MRRAISLLMKKYFSIWNRLWEDNLFLKEDIKQEMLAQYVDPATELESSVFTGLRLKKVPHLGV